MNVPKIRFKEFKDEWKKEKFSQFSYNSGKRNKDNLNLVPYAITNTFGFVPQNEAHNEFGYMKDTDRKAYNIVTKNSFAYNPARINVGSIGYYSDNEDIIVSSLYEVFKTRDYINDKFIWYWLKSDKFPKWINKLQEGSVRQYFYYDKLCETPVYLPSLNEQEKISNTLELLDKKIELQLKKIEDLKLFKIYLNTRLFNNSKWNKVQLSEVLEISNVRNKKNKYSKNDVLSVSDEFGVVNQIDLQGRSFAAKDISDYKIVSKDQIIYTRSPLSSKPYGIIKIVGNIEGIVSPLYIVNNVKKEFIPKFIYYLFDLPSSTNNYLRPLVRMGAKHTMNINDGEWLSGDIYAPSIDEQEKIVKIFEIINKKIKVENNKLNKITELKKGLMQNMFV